MIETFLPFLTSSHGILTDQLVDHCKRNRCHPNTEQCSILIHFHMYYSPCCCCYGLGTTREKRKHQTQNDKDLTSSSCLVLSPSVGRSLSLCFLCFSSSFSFFPGKNSSRHFHSNPIERGTETEQ